MGERGGIASGARGKTGHSAPNLYAPAPARAAGDKGPLLLPRYSGLGVPSLCSAGACSSEAEGASGALSLFKAFSAFFFFFSNSRWRFSNW